MSYPSRSSELMNASDTAMLVVDVQQKLIPVIQSHEQLVWNIGRLLRAAEALQIQTAATEQYPQGLGSTIDLGGPMPTMIEEKTMFSCREADSIFSQWANAGIRKILVCGIETHVCVQQTTLDLLSEGFRVYLAVDAIGARHPGDHQVSLRRMETSGAVLTTSEAAMFEWCETASTPAFKTISSLVREQAPSTS